MITGAVTSRLDPMIQCELRDADGKNVSVNFVIDTGFNGYLALPPKLIQRLSLLADEEESKVTLADSSTSVALLYRVLVEWDASEREVFAIELDGDSLIGTALLYAFRLTIDFDNGGNVTLERFLV